MSAHRRQGRRVEPDREEALDTLFGFPGWASTRLDEWLDLLASLDRHGPAGAVATPTDDRFEVRLDRELGDERIEALTAMAERVNRRAIGRIGRPVIALVRV